MQGRGGARGGGRQCSRREERGDRGVRNYFYVFEFGVYLLFDFHYKLARAES